MSFDPATGALMTAKLAIAVVELAPVQRDNGWFLAQGGGGLAGHRAACGGAPGQREPPPDEEVRLQILRVVVVAVAAGLAAWALSRSGEFRRAT
ncbi:MAG: hypothetical protein H6730_30665 [Deltaproteobacteria bacterium]|nr:hypothetical protein [Deltaproteobacteria bacterium]